MVSWGLLRLPRAPNMPRVPLAVLTLMSLSCSDLCTNIFRKLQCDAERIMSVHRHERYQLDCLQVKGFTCDDMNIHTQAYTKHTDMDMEGEKNVKV